LFASWLSLVRAFFSSGGVTFSFFFSTVIGCPFFVLTTFTSSFLGLALVWEGSVPRAL